MQPIMGAGTNDLRTLWIGDIEPWMNEKHVEDVFNKVGKLWDSLLNFFFNLYSINRSSDQREAHPKQGNQSTSW